MKKKLFASKNEMKHSSRGIFSYKKRKPVKMIKGGHGERNIQYLKKHSLSYAINDIHRVKSGLLSLGVEILGVAVQFQYAHVI